MNDETVPYGTRPPAGWYPEPAGSEALRWWDGSAWSEHRAEAPRSASPRGPGTLGSGFPDLAALLVWLIVVQLAGYVVMAGLYIWGLVGPVDGDQPWYGSPLAYDIVEVLAGMGASLSFFCSVVVWCIWQYQLVRATLPGATRRSPGMQLGSWFIPIVMLWFPLQNMRDLWKVHVQQSAGGILGIWWALWLVTNVTALAIAPVLLGSSTLTFRDYNVLSLADAALWIALCALALVIVRRLTRASLAREAGHPAS